MDAIVTCLAPGGGLARWSPFLGGSDSDAADGLALGPHDAIYLTGETDSADYPVTAGAFDVSWNGGTDAASYTQLRAQETLRHLVCRPPPEKKKNPWPPESRLHYLSTSHPGYR